jgi:hypothetical protein
MAASAYKPDKHARISICSSSWAAAAISSSNRSANICSSSSSESIFGQANGRTPCGHVDEARREEFPDGEIQAEGTLDSEIWLVRGWWDEGRRSSVYHRQIGEGWCRRRQNNDGRERGIYDQILGFECSLADRTGPFPLFSRPEFPSAPRGTEDGLGSPDGWRL